MDKPELIEVLNFLYDHCLVGEQNLEENEKTYFVTARGTSVLKVVASLIREAQKIQTQNFEITSNALSTIKSGTNNKSGLGVYSKKKIFLHR